MKINNKIDKNYDLLSLKLIKSKIYKKKHFLKNIMLNDIECRLKKILYLIYLYHVYDKKILFIGNPLNIYEQIKTEVLQKRGLFFEPKKVWAAGTITNQKKYLKLIFFKKKIDLVIVLDKELNTLVLKESYKSKIVTISLNNDLNSFDMTSSYKVPGNFIFPKTKLKHNFFHHVLMATLRRAYLIRKYVSKETVGARALRTAAIFKKPRFPKKYYSKKKNQKHKKYHKKRILS